MKTGANQSKYDRRTWRHAKAKTTLVSPTPIQGGKKYLPADIENQYDVGICTGISLVQNAEKNSGRKYNSDFHYLLQKKYYDGNWTEGSSLFNSLKVGKNYGFLPAELWTHTTEADRKLPYAQYIAKLQAIPDAEIQRLIGLCVNKLVGYASVALDSQSIAKAIFDSKSGILCRYEVGEEWWTALDGRSSWDPKDIDPLRAPKKSISGHGITASMFNFTVNLNLELANTWGITWDRQGNGTANLQNYRPTEAWIPYYQVIPDNTNTQKLNIISHMLVLIGQVVDLLKQQIAGGR